MSTDSAGAPVRSRRLPLRPLSLVVLLVVGAIAVAGFFVTRQVVHDQEHRLLKQRTDEAGLALSSIGTTVQRTMAFIATAAAQHPGHATFALIGGRLTTPTKPGGKPAYMTAALINTSPTLSIADQVGRPLESIGPQTAAAVNQALAALKDPQKGALGALIATPLFGSSSTTRQAGFVYATPLAPNQVLYLEADVHPGESTSVTAGAPFSELAVAVYATPTVQADQLIISTAGGFKVPLSGTIASVKAPFGAGQPWLMVAKARHALVGSVASAMPWALLAAGLLTAILATAVVETLSRRREYALQIVDERTKELKQSLDDLAAAHSQLIRQERLAAIGELASTIGHELRNPLGVISNALYLLRNDVAKNPPSEAATRHLATADREVSAATVIVSDLLEFARQREPVMVEVDTSALVDEVLSVLPPPTGVTVARQPSPPVLAVADRDMLRQVLLNLIGNAYQAMPDGGTVTVDVAEGADGAQVRVTDTGVGMTDEVREKLFEPFFTTKARGVGLGLAVSKRIIDAHSGTLTVDSRPGAGATFTVTVPQVRLPRQSAVAADDLQAQTSGVES